MQSWETLALMERHLWQQSLLLEQKATIHQKLWEDKFLPEVMFIPTEL